MSEKPKRVLDTASTIHDRSSFSDFDNILILILIYIKQCCTHVVHDVDKIYNWTGRDLNPHCCCLSCTYNTLSCTEQK